MARRPNRRGALAILGSLTAVAAGWQVWLNRPETITFGPIAGAEGWQIAELGEISASPSDAVLLGLDDDSVSPLPLADLQAAVFPNGNKLAVFSDAFCPHCRRLIPSLYNVYPGQVTYHALPFFGPFSERVARAAVAAELQGDGGDLHVFFHATPIRPTPSFFKRAADERGLDGDRLLSDMDSEAVTAKLLTTRRAAERLGLWGTPAVVVGQKVILGSVEPDTLSELTDG